MGLIRSLIGGLTGQGRMSAVDFIEAFRVNAEADAQRTADQKAAALQQLSVEFQTSNTSRFNLFMDGVNRLPRPAMALGGLGAVCQRYDQFRVVHRAHARAALCARAAMVAIRGHRVFLFWCTLSGERAAYAAHHGKIDAPSAAQACSRARAPFCTRSAICRSHRSQSRESFA